MQKVGDKVTVQAAAPPRRQQCGRPEQTTFMILAGGQKLPMVTGDPHGFEGPERTAAALQSGFSTSRFAQRGQRVVHWPPRRRKVHRRSPPSMAR
jgi:hypothetical protein